MGKKLANLGVNRRHTTGADGVGVYQFQSTGKKACQHKREGNFLSGAIAIRNHRSMVEQFHW
jgi:hypothetical protein